MSQELWQEFILDIVKFEEESRLSPPEGQTYIGLTFIPFQYICEGNLLNGYKAKPIYQSNK